MSLCHLSDKLLKRLSGRNQRFTWDRSLPVNSVHRPIKPPECAQYATRLNTLLGVGMQGIAEAVALGELQGLERKRLLEVLSQTAVVAPAHLAKVVRAERTDYSPQFSLGWMNKDLGLILKAADSKNFAMPATKAAFDVNSETMASDPGADFFCHSPHGRPAVNQSN